MEIFQLQAQGVLLQLPVWHVGNWSELSFKEIPLRTDVKGKIGISPICAFQQGDITDFPL